MIHLQLAGRAVTGYEVGTRAQFDGRHAGDGAWAFLDNDESANRVYLPDFFTDPTTYYLDKYNALQKRVLPEPYQNIVFVTDEDGTFLTDPDGVLLTENRLNPAFVKLADGDGALLTDGSDNILSESF